MVQPSIDESVTMVGVVHLQTASDDDVEHDVTEIHKYFNFNM